MNLLIQRLFCLACFLFLSLGTLLAQTQQQLEQEISTYETEITDLERQMARNSSTGNQSRNPGLELQVKIYQLEIEKRVEQLRCMQSSNSNNKNVDETSVAACRAELKATSEELKKVQQIATDLEKANISLTKENARLKGQTGKNTNTAEVERLQDKINRLNSRIKYLEAQNKAAKSSGNKGNKIAKNNKTKKPKTSNPPPPPPQPLGDNHFLRQLRNENRTALVFGGRYSIIPTINTKSANLYHKSEWVGQFPATNITNIAAAGGYGFMGIEFLFHGNHIGGNLGLTANYAYNAGDFIEMHLPHFQVSGEFTIFPIRLGLKAGFNIGYALGRMKNYQVNGASGAISNPEFSSMMLGFDTKARIYLSRYMAFTGYFGADYITSPQLEFNSFNTFFRFGFGIDFIIAFKR